MKRVRIRVDGVVQGVGFRWWGQTVARRLRLTGTITNLWDGRVEIHAQGPDEAVDEFVRIVTAVRPPERRPGRVTESAVADEALVPGETTFDVI